jgi:hypothetical protein
MNLTLDANIIIESHVFGVWDTLANKHQIIVTDTVLAEVDHFRDPETGIRKQINKPGEVIPYGNIINPDQGDLIALTGLFNDVFLERMHPAEREILALAYANKLPTGTYICSADGPAIEALACIDKKDMGISFEAALQTAGLTKNLTYSAGVYKEIDYKKWMERGALVRIQGTYFRL